MGKINRGSIINSVSNELDLASGVSPPPTQLKDDVQGVYIFNPRISSIAKYVTSSTTASGTIYTTPSKGTFYLTSVHFAYTKDVVNDGTTAGVQFYVDGAALYWYLPCQPVTAGSTGFDISLAYPLKIDANTTIKVVGTFAAGTGTKVGTITGYILE